MNEIKKISQTFAEYGIVVEEQDIYKRDLVTTQVEWMELNKKSYQHSMLGLMGMDGTRHALTDFKQFVKKVGLNKEWLNLPTWFTKELRLEFSNYQEGYKLNEAEFRLKIDELKEISLKEDDFFIQKMPLGKADAYQLTKVFDRIKAWEILKPEILARAEALEILLYGNKNLEELTTIITNQLAHKYDRRKNKKG